jgi:uridine kinase
MVGDVIELKEKHLATAKEITALLKKFSIGWKAENCNRDCGRKRKRKIGNCFCPSENSGAGECKKSGLQMDDYFKLPPKTNHENRLKSLDNVGIQEVDLEKLSQNIKDFKTESSEIEKPLVYYSENLISSEKIDTSGYEVILVEGTYILEIEEFDFKIFIDRNYKDTHENRMKRNRDEQSDFVEKVLEIEHQIIRSFKNNADLILGKNYELVNTDL